VNHRKDIEALAQVEGYFGAHLVPQRADHERDRALQRGVIVMLVCMIWMNDYFMQHLRWSEGRAIALWVASAYSLSSFAYWSFLRAHPASGVALQYVFLIADPVVLMTGMVVDPHRLASLNPFLLIVIIRCGIRYGTRTMWLAWGVTVAAALLLLPASEYWRKEGELALSFGLLLALIPVFFISLIRRVHQVRAIEEERARLGALNEITVSRSEFLSKVSHELRSPLQSIVSALDVFEMRHGHGVAEDDELIGRMRRSSMLLNTQLRDLQTLAKGEAGHLAMHPEPFEAAALVEGVAIAARDAAHQKGLALQVDLPSDPVFVVADGSRIDQVLTNLVVNSVRYTESGEVRLTLHPFDQATSQLHFTVADTGPGIPRDLLPSLLEPDKLVAPAAAPRKGEGSGIGLAVVRTLVDHLGGTISVNSREGLGTTFDVRIPAEHIDPDTSSAVDSTADDHRRVLIIDDREDVLVGLTSVINELGYECDRALSTAVAANLLAARRYDAVLIDIQMPGKNGAELAAETRAGKGPNRETRLLGMSAAEVTARYEQGPFDALLTKPIDRNALISALRVAWPETWPSSTI
jgi:signal transduction histidine kinase/ActR/RegA family two-component response regulator